MNRELSAVKKREKAKKARAAKKKHNVLMKKHERHTLKKEIEEAKAKIKPRPKMTKAQADARTKAMQENTILNSRAETIKEVKEEDDGNKK